MHGRTRRSPWWLLVALGLITTVTLAGLSRSASLHAAQLTAGGFTTTATVSPTSVSPGGSVTLTAAVTSDAARSALVNVEVYSPSGATVHQHYVDNQAFSAGVRRDYPVAWRVPAGSASGTYVVKIGIFAPGWASLSHWNDSAATFNVAATAATPTPTPTTAATPTPTAAATPTSPTPTAVATPTPTTSPGGTGLPPLPQGWPSTLQLGMMDSPGGAAGMQATAPFGFRYQYLSGGVNTGNGWATWNSDGHFVTYYIQDSTQHGIQPAFTYYMIYQSAPGGGSEADAVLSNLQNTSTMTAYYQDLKLFFQRAGAFPSTLVTLHVEPDMWGYAQQRATNDNAASIPVKVAATALPELAGLPENLSGFARAVVKLRDTYAPNVRLGYHLSVWGRRLTSP